MDLITANKQLTAILEMINNSEKNDFVMYDNFYKNISDKALQISNLVNKKVK